MHNVVRVTNCNIIDQHLLLCSVVWYSIIHICNQSVPTGWNKLRCKLTDHAASSERILAVAPTSLSRYFLLNTICQNWPSPAREHGADWHQTATTALGNIENLPLLRSAPNINLLDMLLFPQIQVIHPHIWRSAHILSVQTHASQLPTVED